MVHIDQTIGRVSSDSLVAHSYTIGFLPPHRTHSLHPLMNIKPQRVFVLSKSCFLLRLKSLYYTLSPKPRNSELSWTLPICSLSTLNHWPNSKESTFFVFCIQSILFTPGISLVLSFIISSYKHLTVAFCPTVFSHQQPPVHGNKAAEMILQKSKSDHGSLLKPFGDSTMACESHGLLSSGFCLLLPLLLSLYPQLIIFTPAIKEELGWLQSFCPKQLKG